MKNKVTLITGGARSGKSNEALRLAGPYSKKAFIATAIGFDDEMKERIAKHQAERGDDFITIEEPHNLAGAIQSIPDEVDYAIIDCLTVWLANLMHKHEDDNSAMAEIAAFRDILENPPHNLIIVTNEVGSGIVPENAQARKFRDLAGKLNQDVAVLADSVILTVSGIPVNLK